MDYIRWKKPVRAGDALSCRRTVLEKRASGSSPGAGLARQRGEAVNQRAELVLEMEGWGMFERRPSWS
jgi:acyl dehydratase